MAMIVTRQQAMDHLRIDDATDEADDLDLKIAAASAIVLDYIEATATDYEDSDSDSDSDSGSDSDGSSATYTWPDQLQAATLLLLGDMHRFRDNVMTSRAGLPIYNDAQLPGPVRAILHPLKTYGLSDE